MKTMTRTAGPSEFGGTMRSTGKGIFLGSTSCGGGGGAEEAMMMTNVERPDLPGILAFFTEAETESLAPRQHALLKRVVRVCETGFTLRELPIVDELLDVAHARLCDGSLGECESTLCKMVRLCGRPGLREKANEDRLAPGLAAAERILLRLEALLHSPSPRVAVEAARALRAAASGSGADRTNNKNPAAALELTRALFLKSGAVAGAVAELKRRCEDLLTLDDDGTAERVAQAVQEALVGDESSDDDGGAILSKQPSRASTTTTTTRSKSRGGSTARAPPTKKVARKASPSSPASHREEEEEEEEPLVFSTAPRTVDYEEAQIVLALVKLLRELSWSGAAAAHLVRCGGMAACVAVLRVYLEKPLASEAVSVTVEVMWNALEHSAAAVKAGAGVAPARSRAELLARRREDNAMWHLADDTSLAVLRQLLSNLCFHGRAAADKQLRNEVLIVASHIASHRKSHEPFRTQKLLHLILAYAVASERSTLDDNDFPTTAPPSNDASQGDLTEASPLNDNENTKKKKKKKEKKKTKSSLKASSSSDRATVRAAATGLLVDEGEGAPRLADRHNFATGSAEDLEMKRIMWALISDLGRHDQDNLEFIVAADFMAALLMYLDAAAVNGEDDEAYPEEEESHLDDDALRGSPAGTLETTRDGEMTMMMMMMMPSSSSSSAPSAKGTKRRVGPAVLRRLPVTQLHVLQQQAMAVLLNLAPRAPQQFQAIQGHLVTLRFLDACDPLKKQPPSHSAATSDADANADEDHHHHHQGMMTGYVHGEAPPTSEETHHLFFDQGAEKALHHHHHHQGGRKNGTSVAPPPGALIQGALMLLVSVVGLPGLQDDLGELDAVRIMLRRFNDEAAAPPLRSDAVQILSKLCERHEGNQARLRRLDGVQALVHEVEHYCAGRDAAPRSKQKPTVRAKGGGGGGGGDEEGVVAQVQPFGAAPASEKVAPLIVGVLDCLWNAVVGNRRSEARLPPAHGIDALLSILEVGPRLMRHQVCGLLADLSKNDKLVPYLRAWRSDRSMRSAAQVLAHMWEDEEVRLGYDRPQGIIANLDKPLRKQRNYRPASSFKGEKKETMVHTDGATATTREAAEEEESRRRRDDNKNEEDTPEQETTLDNKPTKKFGFNGDDSDEEEDESDSDEELWRPTAPGATKNKTAGALLATKFARKSHGGSLASTTSAKSDRATKQAVGACDLRGKVAPIVAAIGHDVAGEGIPAEDRATLCMIRHYETFRDGEAWAEVRDALRAEHVKPIAADAKLLDLKLGACQETAVATRDDQRHLAAERDRDEEAHEAAFLGTILLQRDQEIRQLAIKRYALVPKSLQNRRRAEKAAAATTTKHQHSPLSATVEDLHSATIQHEASVRTMPTETTTDSPGGLPLEAYH